MNKKMRKRLAVVSAAVVITLAIVLGVVGEGTSSKSVSVMEAASGNFVGQKVQVSGNVVENSFVAEGDVLSFSIYDPEGDSEAQLEVRYAGAASSTFGNDVTAICTGRLGDDGVLQATELITKCPSKYEGADASQHPPGVTAGGK